MHLKLFVLSASSVVLWLAPLATLDKTLDIHKALQGVSLTAAFACAVTAGNIAREQAEQNDIEEIKIRAITADVVDEIATSIYISEQQRRKEAEAILAASSEEVEAKREALEAIYTNDLQPEVSASTDENDTKEIELWWKVEAAQVQGKTTTWIIENILGKKGRKFSEGKKQLEELLKKFSEEGG